MNGPQDFGAVFLPACDHGCIGQHVSILLDRTSILPMNHKGPCLEIGAMLSQLEMAPEFYLKIREPRPSLEVGVFL